jgi:hypothetical protein
VWYALNYMTAAFDHPPPGQKRAAPYLRINELMDPPEKSSVWAQERRELRVVVLLRLGCTPVYRITSGSSWEGMDKLVTYLKKDGTEYKVLSGAEYVDCVKSGLGELNVTRDGNQLRPPEHLLHDKAPQHTAKVVKQELSKHIQLVLLPTDSPDLTPCDSNFFGEVKARWQRELARDPRSWAESCKLALNIITEADPDKHIKALPLRWKACRNAEGWHIEQEYKKLKAIEKAG